MPDDEQLPVPVELDMNKLAKLARELAWDMHKTHDILARYGLTEDQFVVLKEIPFFKNALEALTIEWNSAASTEDRIKLQAAMGAEDLLPHAIARMHKPDETLNAVIDGVKMLTSIAGINKETKTGNNSEKFTITINLGEDHKLTFEKDITPTPALETGDRPIPEDGEGKGDAAPIRVLTQGKGGSV